MRSKLLKVVILVTAAIVVESLLLAAPPAESKPTPDSPTTAQVELLADAEAVAPGQAFTLAVKIQTEPDWHVYWKHPGDAGLATRLTWSLPEGWKAGALRWPKPTTFKQPGDIVGYGYTGEVLLGATVTPPKDAPVGKSVSLQAHVEWLACKDKCIPGEATARLELPVAKKPSPANKSVFETWRKQLNPLAKDFTLKDSDGKDVTLRELQGKVVVLEWFNPDCPFVKRHHEKRSTHADLARKYADKNVVWLAINSTHYMKPDVTADWVKKWEIPYPVLIDRDGKVGRAYKAKTTPHMFVINEAGEIVYHGALDDDPPGKKTSPENYIDKVLADLTAGRPVSVEPNKSYGCSVKYATP
jgi:DsbC/DsbD-like thiol-disulfide interchange protein